MLTPVEISTKYIQRFGSSSMGDAGAIALAAEIFKHKEWMSIQVDRSEIGPNGVESLVKAIEASSIELFSLTQNPINDVGAQHLSEALKNTRFNLKKLHINCCNIGIAGAAALAESLKENTKLQLLNLEGNLIGDEGAVALAEAIKRNKSLKHIYLGRNNIGDVGATALAQALRANTSIERIFINHNPISQHAAQNFLESGRGRDIYLHHIPAVSDINVNTGAAIIPRPIQKTNAKTNSITNAKTNSMWNKKTLIRVMLAVDVLANLTAYFVGGALSAFLFSPPGIILSVLIASVGLSFQVDESVHRTVSP